MESERKLEPQFVAHARTLNARRFGAFLNQSCDANEAGGGHSPLLTMETRTVGGHRLDITHSVCAFCERAVIFIHEVLAGLGLENIGMVPVVYGPDGNFKMARDAKRIEKRKRRR